MKDGFIHLCPVARTGLGSESQHTKGLWKCHLLWLTQHLANKISWNLKKKNLQLNKLSFGMWITPTSLFFLSFLLSLRESS